MKTSFIQWSGRFQRSSLSVPICLNSCNFWKPHSSLTSSCLSSYVPFISPYIRWLSVHKKGFLSCLSCCPWVIDRPGRLNLPQMETQYAFSFDIFKFLIVSLLQKDLELKNMFIVFYILYIIKFRIPLIVFAPPRRKQSFITKCTKNKYMVCIT